MISVKQPFAWAIASGRKKIENRTWQTPYRGVVYIHASGAFDRKGADWLAKNFRIKMPADEPRGAIVAVAELTDVVTRRGAKRFGRWFTGPYGFVLSDVRILRSPVKTLGKLGLFRPSPSLKRSVEKQLRRR
ncbi:MAG: ASCH domain-containing protein [Acidobacteriota bacterium]|nr:ASCH domain-containing protein [Acidobacteriota bacterium]